MNKVLIVVMVIIVGGGAFYGGMKYDQNQASSKSTTAFQQFRNGAGGRRGGLGGEFVNGEVISKDDQSVTIKLRDGGSKIVFLSDSTEISRFTAGALSDLEVGNNIIVNGTANSDGSVTAQAIQLRPSLNRSQ